MRSMDPLVLYSTNTTLAYHIAERYYSGVHYVWCTPHFDARCVPPSVPPPPPTSAPGDVYHDLLLEVIAGDTHSSKIRQNRAGIIKGALLKEKAGLISQKQRDEISAIVRKSEVKHFKPLLFVIPYKPAAPLLKSVPVAKRATPMSEEYIAEQLPRALFDVIHLERRQS